MEQENGTTKKTKTSNRTIVELKLEESVTVGTPEKLLIVP